jgi:hypothetical protein
MIRQLNPPGPGLLPRTVSAVAHDGARGRPTGLSERLTHASHQYLLPAIGAGAATLGGVLLLGAGASTRPYLPFALVGLGAAAVVSSVAFHQWQYRRSAPPTTVPPAPSAIRVPPYGHAPSVPHSGIGRATTSPIAGPGEDIWRQWETPIAGPLGAALTGPIPESAYVPAAIARSGPYTGRDVDLMLAPFAARPRSEPVRGPVGIPGAPRRVPVPTVRSSANARARLAARRRAPFSQAELDAMFPPDLPPAPVVTPLPLATAEISPIPLPRSALAFEGDAVALPLESRASPSSAFSPEAEHAAPRAPVSLPIADQPTGRFRILPSLLSLRDPLYVETIHPLPPHRRSSLAPAGARAAGVRPPSTLDRPTECVGCLRALSGFRGWVICPGCHRALCRRCLGASFHASPDGQCSRCRPWHVPPAN